MSAKARFFEPLLWVVKISDLLFLGRARPVVAPLEGCERREESVLLKAREEGVDVGAAVFGRGAPYSEEVDAMVKVRDW